MKVKDVIIHALRLLEREDIAQKLEEDKTTDGEASDMVKALVFCYNAVEEELSRNVFPLVAEEQFTSVTGRVSIESFSKPVTEILSVKSDGRETAYTLSGLYLKTDALHITVRYTHPPAKKTLSDDGEYGGLTGERLPALGIAAEYCLISGRIKSAEVWQSRYESEISEIKYRRAKGGCVPARRWI